MLNFGGRGNDVTVAVKGESVQWTSSLRSLDTCPLRAFIIKSIHSFIICISAIMHGGAISTTDGQLVSCRSCLLGAILPSDPSWFLLLALVPSWSSSWVLNAAFLWHSYSSRSWFCLVRRSTVAARIWTCLSKVVVRGSSPWWLVVVAIKRVCTKQLFVREAISMAYFLLLFPTNSANWLCWKLSVSHTVLTCSKQHLHNTEQEDLRKVPAWYWPKTLRRLS